MYSFVRLSLTISLIPLAALSSAQMRYSVVDIGPGVANGINERGEVTGGLYTPTGERAFVYRSADGTLTDLGLPHEGGYMPYSEGRAINDSGQVAVVSDKAVSDATAEGFLYENGAYSDGFGYGEETEPFSINDSGQIAGYSETVTGATRAFVYQNGTMTDLGDLGFGAAYARGINEQGQVVGGSLVSSFVQHAFLYDSGTMKDIGTLAGGSSSYAFGINDHSQIVGSSSTRSGQDHAFLYQSGTMLDLGTLTGGFSDAWAINNVGQIVGSSSGAGGVSHAFVYEEGRMFDLNKLAVDLGGLTLVQAYGINDLGQIVGLGIRNGQARAFVATPNAVPEPGAFAAMALGAAAVVRRRKKP